MTKIFSFAIVTSMGIYINDSFYTCAKAVEKQWFYQAAVCGEWMVPVIYSKELRDTIKVIYNGEILTAAIVPDKTKLAEFVIRSIVKEIS